MKAIEPPVVVRWLTSLALCTTMVLAVSVPATADPSDVALVDVFTGLDRPTGVEIAPTGDIYVIEKPGRLKVFDGFDDPTPDVVVDWEPIVMSAADQGMLGLAVDPLYGRGRNYVYVYYTLDEVPGGTDPPRWNEACPAVQSPGCVVTAALSRIEVDPVSHAALDVLDLQRDAVCVQFGTHSANDLAFGPDGYLYASAGEGGGFTVADYGQLDGNPCMDPPYPAKATPENGEGGAFRSFDLLTSTGGEAADPVWLQGEAADPVWLQGAVVRIDPDTGAAAPGNPLIGQGVPGDDPIIAHGFRNPYRIEFRPGTDELWVGDVGWYDYEEVNVIADVNDQVVENFGWPCFEGPNLHVAYAQYGMCQTLLDDPESFLVQTELTQAWYPYPHTGSMAGCEATGSSAISAMAFGIPGSGPPEYDGALFLADWGRQCLWAMLPDADGIPDPSRIELLATGIGATDLHTTPTGEILIVEPVDFSSTGGRIRRLEYLGGNEAPMAVISANTLVATHGETRFEFDGTGSTDPEGRQLTYQWDLDGDGTVDSTDPTATIVYPDPGTYVVRLRVTDPDGAGGEDTATVNVSNTPPVVTITEPAGDLSWRVGDVITFAGSAVDAEDGPLAPDTPGREWEWLLVLQHCPGGQCHEHQEASWTRVAGGTLSTPDHEYPSYLELWLKVTDSAGATETAMVELQPLTSTVTLLSDPPGLELAGGVSGIPRPAPVVLEAIENGQITVTAPSLQTVGGTTYVFDGWSDGGAAVHDVTVPEDDLTLTATYVELGGEVVARLEHDWVGAVPGPGWSYWWHPRTFLTNLL